MMELYYNREEAKRMHQSSECYDRLLAKEIEECSFGNNVSDVASFIEEHIFIHHHSTDRAFLSSDTKENHKRFTSGGDTVRGRLHKETFYGAIQLPLESGRFYHSRWEICLP